MVANPSPSETTPHPTVGRDVKHSTSFMANVEQRFLTFIRHREILRPSERLVVAVSGGPDSTALHLLLTRLQHPLSLDISLAHFDHCLRTPDDARHDRVFVETLAFASGRPFAHGKGDVRARARTRHESLEDAARNLRYQFLRREARKVSATAVATGHTLDDQAETVLLHLLRGSGLDGLRAMQPRASWPFGVGPDIARPLLCLRRDETERYCREAGLDPLHDPTNDQPIAVRNRIRNQLLPALRAFNPRVDEALVRLADAAAGDSEFVEIQAGDIWREIAVLSPLSVSFPREPFERLHAALQTRLIRSAISHTLGSSADLEAVHLRTIVEALTRARTRLSLPHGIVVTLDSRFLSVRKGQPPVGQRIPETALMLPGRTTVTGWAIDAALIPPPTDPRAATPLEAFLDAEAVGENLSVRSRRPGDRLRPLGLGGEKKVQDILVDARVPAAQRDGVPIVSSKSGIAWIAGHCIDEAHALTASTKRVIHLRAQPNPTFISKRSLNLLTAR